MSTPFEPKRLMTPGPVPSPQAVLDALALPLEHHRTPSFAALFQRCLSRLPSVFGTKQPAFVLTSTGSGGMEALLVNLLSPGEHIIAVVSGKFGERWADMAERYGIIVHRLEIPWGLSVQPEQVEEALKRHPEAVAVITQACETSTGALHPIREIAALLRQTDRLLLVDAITALGCMSLPMDDWGIDAVVGGSQKAFMLPTGLSFVSFSEKAWRRIPGAKCPRYYFDIREELKANRNGESFFSTPVSHFRALDVILEGLQGEGLMRLFARIEALSRATRAALPDLGLRSFPAVPSPSLSCLALPEGVDGQALRQKIESVDSITVMGGQDQLKGKVIRIGHMGAISDQDLLATIESIAHRLRDLGHSADEAALRRATEAAHRWLITAPELRFAAAGSAASS